MTNLPKGRYPMKKHCIFKVFISILIAVYLLTLLPFAIYGDSVLMSYMQILYPINPIIVYVTEKIYILEFMQSLLLDIAIVSILFSAIITAFIYVLSITLKKYLHKYPGNDYIKVKKTQLSKILCTGKVFFYFFCRALPFTIISLYNYRKWQIL